MTPNLPNLDPLGASEYEADRKRVKLLEEQHVGAEEPELPAVAPGVLRVQQSVPESLSAGQIVEAQQQQTSSERERETESNWTRWDLNKA